MHHRKHSSPIAQLNVTLWPRIKCFSGAEYHGRLCLLRRALLCSALHLAETSAEEEGGAQEPGGAELMRKVAERVAQGIPPEDLNETPQERGEEMGRHRLFDACRSLNNTTWKIVEKPKVGSRVIWRLCVSKLTSQTGRKQERHRQEIRSRLLFSDEEGVNGSCGDISVTGVQGQRRSDIASQQRERERESECMLIL